MGICYIVGAGDCEKLDFIKKESDLLIAADAGYEYIIKNNLQPDIIIGDFDSFGEIPDAENVVKLNPVKDITDMHAAVEEGIRRGFRKFILYGAMGGRFDHSLANIQLTASLSQKGFSVSIADGERIITAITDSAIRFDSSEKGFISVFSHTDKCEGVCLKGLKYSLDNAELTNNFALGVSNEFIGEESFISVKKGTLIIIYSK